MIRTKPLLALTIGDPAGVGPEICVRVATNPELREVADIILWGNSNVLQEACKRFLDTDVTITKLTNLDVLSGASNDNEIVCYCPDEFAELDMTDFEIGKVSAVAGKASYDYVVSATKAVIEDKVDAIVTAPVNKAAINMAGIENFSGHTELIAELCQTPDVAMMQSAEGFRVAFVTTHIPLSQVCKAVTQERIVHTAKLLYNVIRLEGIVDPVLGMPGLNPHAGEDGYMGREEIDIVKPAMEELRKLGIKVEGPYPPDTIFMEEIRNKFDGIVSHYHDQGHIPFKMVAFDRGVNSTLGLPIIRTSVDHGTAFDRAWKGTADTGSLKAALKLAAKRVTGS